MYCAEHAHLCGVWSCAKSAGVRGGFCVNHDKWCTVPGCEARTDKKSGYCWDHDKTLNPHYPHESAGDKVFSYAFQAATVVFVAWAAIFAFNFLTSPAAGECVGGEDLHFTGPECPLTYDHYFEAIGEFRSEATDLGLAQFDLCADIADAKADRSIMEAVAFAAGEDDPQFDKDSYLDSMAWSIANDYSNDLDQCAEGSQAFEDKVYEDLLEDSEVEQVYNSRLGR